MSERFEFIATDAQLQDFCRELADAPTIGFDTEFVSEDTYRPQLCLVQVAAGDRLAIIDPLELSDLNPFWELLAAPGHETIVHAGREELLFCMAATGVAPHNLFDLQIAAGLVGYEYPAGYGSLMLRLLGEKLQKGETRTDWRRRPLSDAQLTYAIDDVEHLKPMRDKLHASLSKFGRVSWLADEMAAWQADVIGSMTRERWRRTSGISGLSSRSLAIVRSIWQWREGEAERRNQPARWVLRDDLVIEIAKRRSSDPKHMKAIRGLDRNDNPRYMKALSDAVAEALALPDDECPKPPPRDPASQFTVLGQFVSSALGSICRAAELAPSLVGTATDVRDVIAYRLNVAGSQADGPPLLARGWRAEVVGRKIEDLLDGKIGCRVRDPRADEPLEFV